MSLDGTELPHPNGVGKWWAPHCDNAVLHAPGECEACDHYPAWQRYRQVARIAFSGHEPTDGEAMCPSETRRPAEVIWQWAGNQPMTYSVSPVTYTASPTTTTGRLIANRVTADPADPRLTHGFESLDGPPVDQAPVYLVLSEEERAKGFVRPVRFIYKHIVCGTQTSMGKEIAETYACQPGFYGATFCVYCSVHRPVGEQGEFIWEDGTKVGT